MLLLEEQLRSKEAMQDQVEPKKKEIRLRSKAQGWREHLAPSFINSFFTRATQRTLRFIPWLRDCLHKRLAYGDSLAELANVWQC